MGFDSFEVDADQSIDVWNNALRSMSLAYQRGYDGEQSTRELASGSHNQGEGGMKMDLQEGMPG